jgi:hypothetical protein
MKWKYTILPEPLHPVADLTIEYFIKHRGVRSSTIQIEQPLAPDVRFRPTFTARTSDHYTLCVEVAEEVYTNSRDEFVLTCLSKALPVKLFISIPTNTKDPGYSQKLQTARSRGVGVIEIDEHSTNVIQEALPLYLSGVRQIDVKTFPAKLREALVKAETTFRNSSPEKGCATIYEEIESICRIAGQKTHDAGHWKQQTNFNFQKDPWAKLMQLMEDHLDINLAKCPDLSRALIARIHGLTTYRNDSGHKPANAKALINRNRQLRTRFEGAVDVLSDLVAAVKPLRVL